MQLFAWGYGPSLVAVAGQEIVAKRFNRPSNPAVAAKFASQFDPNLKLFKFGDHFKDWPTVMKQHFAQGGELDQMRK